MYNRILKNSLLKSPKSFLLLGPRQVGKTTLIKSLKPDIFIDLADLNEFVFQSESSSNFMSYIKAQQEILANSNPHASSKQKITTCFVDEIQKKPDLFNSIQSILDHEKLGENFKFFLSGSSARKLKRGGANLIPGRIFKYNLGPISFKELEYKANLKDMLSYGCLPEVLTFKELEFKKKLLQAYSETYIKEEIQAESLVRSIEGYIRFLKASCGFSGKFMDYSKTARVAKLPRQTCVRFYEILEDTLIMNKVESYSSQIEDEDLVTELDLVKHAKFFIFDLGVLNALLKNFLVSEDRKGLLFEHLFVNQIFNSLNTNDETGTLYNFRRRNGLEVDFIFDYKEELHVVELKSSNQVSKDHRNKFSKIEKILQKTTNKKIKSVVLYSGERSLKEENYWVMPIQDWFKQMGL